MLIQAKIQEGMLMFDDERGEFYFSEDGGEGFDLSKESTRKLYELLDSFKSTFLNTEL